MEMNEQIKLLAEQAGCAWWEGRALRDMTRCHHELEKFAELIIQECLTKCDAVQTMYGQYTFTARKCKEAIAEHFGVEE
jgi:hypothetical protein